MVKQSSKPQTSKPRQSSKSQAPKPRPTQQQGKQQQGKQQQGKQQQQDDQTTGLIKKNPKTVNPILPRSPSIIILQTSYAHCWDDEVRAPIGEGSIIIHPHPSSSIPSSIYSTSVYSTKCSC